MGKLRMGREKKDSNYRKLIVGVLLSLPHWPGILEFMDFIYCVEAGEGENQHLSKLKLLWAICSLIQRLIALLQVKHRTGSLLG